MKAPFVRSGKYLYYTRPSENGKHYCIPLYDYSSNIAYIFNQSNMSKEGCVSDVKTVKVNNDNYYIFLGTNCNCTGTTYLRLNNKYFMNGVCVTWFREEAPYACLFMGALCFGEYTRDKTWTSSYVYNEYPDPTKVAVHTGFNYYIGYIPYMAYPQLGTVGGLICKFPNPPFNHDGDPALQVPYGIYHSGKVERVNGSANSYVSLYLVCGKIEGSSAYTGPVSIYYCTDFAKCYCYIKHLV